MMSLTWRRSRRGQKTRFVPTSLGGSDQMRLEDRALAAPLFWRQPGAYTGDDISGTDWVDAQAVGQFSAPPDILYLLTEFAAQASSDSVNTVPTGAGTATLVLSGTATSDAEDLTQTFAPANPVGTSAVSMNSTATLTGNYLGDGTVVANAFTSQGRTSRLYALADTSGTPAATNIVEHASVQFASSIGAIRMVAGVGQGVGLTINVFGDSSGITGANINGVNVTVPSSGTITAGGAVITYGVSTTALDATSVTPVGTLPTVSRDSAGFVSGVAWPASTFSRLVIAPGVYAMDANGLATLSTHYDAHFA